MEAVQAVALPPVLASDGPRPQILDLSHLRRFTMGSVAFEREVVGLFIAELPKTLAGLERAQTAAEWHMAAHTLKGSALGIGACRLAQAAREAERMKYLSPAERTETMSQIKAAILDVVGEAARLRLV